MYRIVKLLFLAAGLALLALIVAGMDLTEVVGLVRQVGWGIAVLLGLYFLAFMLDTVSWQITLLKLNGLAWLNRLFQVRLAGEAFNNTTPLAGFGGEPVKAMMLKNCHGVEYRDAIASLILAKTINTLALVVFLGMGLVLVLGSDALQPAYKYVAGVGLGALSVGVALFYLVQRFRVTSTAGGLLARGRLAGRMDAVLGHVRDMDDRLAGFYSGHRGRFFAAMVLAWLNWGLGVVEIYYTLIFLGHPVTLTEAWIIETVAQLVRAGTFFIPASIGAQEGAFLVIGSALTGSPALGLAAALVRRIREILWILWGFAVFWLLKPARQGLDRPPTDR
jgi:uncharacterized protein (TIRG00374 family)